MEGNTPAVLVTLFIMYLRRRVLRRRNALRDDMRRRRTMILRKWSDPEFFEQLPRSNNFNRKRRYGNVGPRIVQYANP